MRIEGSETISTVLDNIARRRYLLPAIQRELVWDQDQITKFFDSLMRGYPIGVFLFWLVRKENSNNYQFYEFIGDYHERDNFRNPKANVSGSEDITAILDGQQRLTALYIGYLGSYSYKMPYKRWDNDEAFPKRHLYLNILSGSDDMDMEYDFRFLTESEAKQKDESTFWYRVKDMMLLKDISEIFNGYLGDQDQEKIEKHKACFAFKALTRLFQITHQDGLVSFFLEKSDDLNKVLNIFIRVNSGGTQLTYSDLLLSIATAQWQQKDAREEISGLVDELNGIGNKFAFNKDFVLKASLVLGDFSDIRFMVDNFNKRNMNIIEQRWDEITTALRLTTHLVYSFGFNRDTLTSNNALIPIAYYLLKKGNPKNFILSSHYLKDRATIQKWLILSLLKKAFSGQPDNVLRPLREILSKNSSDFPLQEIIGRFRGTNRSLIFDTDDIENLLYYGYGQAYTFSVLSFLYPAHDFRNQFHVDHIFPKSIFTRSKLQKKGIDVDKLDFYLSNYNAIANLQLIEGVPNQEKGSTDFKEWVDKTYPNPSDKKNYMDKHYIPDVDLDIKNFDKFIEERKKLLIAKFQSILQI